MQIAQDISSRMYVKKRSRSGLRRGFLICILEEIVKSRCVSYFSTVPSITYGNFIGKMELCRVYLIFVRVRNCQEITHQFDLYKCPSAASDNLDVARYACDYLLCS